MAGRGGPVFSLPSTPGEKRSQITPVLCQNTKHVISPHPGSLSQPNQHEARKPQTSDLLHLRARRRGRSHTFPTSPHPTTHGSVKWEAYLHDILQPYLAFLVVLYLYTNTPPVRAGTCIRLSLPCITSPSHPVAGAVGTFLIGPHRPIHPAPITDGSVRHIDNAAVIGESHK
ncbi:unnamed protein product [Cyclocybe aegerita]|uniref:Uncharacterized protein n=1 Tax=Cyclocybe aegerita TaxID=1973307 RepID=A0A8S0VRX9_CYCAE|nr:unnamed protein product [Cyclocybe aegerita]